MSLGMVYLTVCHLGWYTCQYVTWDGELDYMSIGMEYFVNMSLGMVFLSLYRLGWYTLLTYHLRWYT